MKDIRRAQPLFSRWNNMIFRCHSSSSKSYRHYGARGITVDERWRGAKGFAAFVADMGAPPAPGLTIERINNDGPYSPENCRWATRREQSLNSRRVIWVTVDNVTQCVTDWARQLGVRAAALRNRARRLGGNYEAAICSYTARPPRRSPQKAGAPK